MYPKVCFQFHLPPTEDENLDFASFLLFLSDVSLLPFSFAEFSSTTSFLPFGGGVFGHFNLCLNAVMVYLSWSEARCWKRPHPTTDDQPEPEG